MYGKGCFSGLKGLMKMGFSASSSLRVYEKFSRTTGFGTPSLEEEG
jgi:hypothetical protein